MTRLRFLFAVLFAGLALVCSAGGSSAQDQKVIVTVNDQPITSFDVQKRINLWKLLGTTKNGSGNPKTRALNELIDDIAMVEEAKKFGAQPNDKDIDSRLGDIAKGLGTDSNGLGAKLKSQGTSVAAMRHYISGQIAFGRLVRGKYKEDFSVTDAEVKKRTSGIRAEIDGDIKAQIRKLESDPRRKAVTVYQLMEIKFPVDAPEGEITGELLQSRAIEANQFMSRFKGCGSARSAAAGIFNVQLGKKLDADGSRLPKPLKQALDKAGPGKAIGPVRDQRGIQVIALCDIRKIAPQKIQPPKDIKYPNEKQVRGMLEQEKFAAVQRKYAGKFRKGLLIEYRDPSFGQ